MAQVSFHGSIGKVRELAFNNDGKARLNFSVAENHSKLDRNTNTWIDEGVTWWQVTVFGKLAEALADTLREGAKQRVSVGGRSKTREYDKNDGTKGSSLEVVADHVGLIPAAGSGGQARAQQGAQADDPWATTGPASSGTFADEPPF